MIEDEEAGTKPNLKYPEHGQKGFRNRGARTGVSIVVMGDSQTYGTNAGMR